MTNDIRTRIVSTHFNGTVNFEAIPLAYYLVFSPECNQEIISLLDVGDTENSSIYSQIKNINLKYYITGHGSMIRNNFIVIPENLYIVTFFGIGEVDYSGSNNRVHSRGGCKLEFIMDYCTKSHKAH